MLDPQFLRCHAFFFLDLFLYLRRANLVTFWKRVNGRLIFEALQVWKSYLSLAINLIVWLSIESSFGNHLPEEFSCLSLPQDFLFLLLVLGNRMLFWFFLILLCFSESFWDLLLALRALKFHNNTSWCLSVFNCFLCTLPICKFSVYLSVWSLSLGKFSWIIIFFLFLYLYFLCSIWMLNLLLSL